MKFSDDFSLLFSGFPLFASVQWVWKMCRFVQKKNEGGEIENRITTPKIRFRCGNMKTNFRLAKIKHLANESILVCFGRQ